MGMGRDVCRNELPSKTYTRAGEKTEDFQDIYKGRGENGSDNI